MVDGDESTASKTSAVTVVGIGAAGCRMLSAVREAAETSDPDAVVEYVALDSSENELEKYAPEGSVRVSLSYTEERFEQDRQSVDYLHLGLDFPYSLGTFQQRPLGRYAVDNAESFDRTYETLAETIRETHETETASGAAGAHQIWLLYALGGGTGSGAFPLVAAMIDDIVAGLSGDVTVGALGSLPRLDALEERSTSPAGPEQFYVNAYAALRELAVLLDDDGETEFPLSVPVESAADAESMAADAFTLQSPPVDAYGLLGVTETTTREYRDIVNDVAARTVLGLGEQAVDPSQDGLDRYRDPSGPDGVRLFSVDGSQVSLPVEDLQAVADLDERLSDLEEDRQRLDDRLSALTESVEFVSDVLNAEPEQRDELTNELEDRVRDLALPAAQPSDLERVVGEVSAEISVPEHVDADDVAGYLTTAVARERLSERRDEHEFLDELERAREKYRDSLEERVVEEMTSEYPLPLWETVLQPFLEDLISQLDERLSETLPVRIFETSGLRARLETARSEYRELEALAAEYERLDELLIQADNQFKSSRVALRRRRNELEERVDETETRLDTVRADLEEANSRRDALMDRLQSGDVSPYVVEPPVADVDGAVRAVTGPAFDSLTALLDFEFLAEDTLEEAVSNAQSALEEPVQDRVGADDVDTLLIHAAEGDHDLVDVQQPGTVLEHGPTAPYTLSLTGLFGPVDLQATSEFRTIHEWFSDSGRDVSTQLGSDVTDRDVTEAFAYPELVSNL